MQKILKFSIILLLIFNIFSIGILSLQAAAPPQGPTPSGQTLDSIDSANYAPRGLVPDDQPGKCPPGYTGNCGNYRLNDIMLVVVNVSNLILELVGSLALLAFIAGGLMWLLSAGNAEWVTRGKQTVIGAAIGLAVVFTSFMIIQLVYSALGAPASNKWWQTPAQKTQSLKSGGPSLI